MQCWINVPSTDGVDDKIRMAYILLKPNIPAFHHSIFPFSGQIRKPKKTFILSVSCRISETLNYESRKTRKMTGTISSFPDLAAA